MREAGTERAVTENPESVSEIERWTLKVNERMEREGECGCVRGSRVNSWMERGREKRGETEIVRELRG